MKKYILIGIFALALGAVSCEPEQSNEELEELATGHGEVGDPEEEEQQEGGGN